MMFMGVSDMLRKIGIFRVSHSHIDVNNNSFPVWMFG